MKRILTILLCLSLCLSLAACSSKSGTGNDKLDKEVDDALDTLKDIINNATDDNGADSIFGENNNTSTDTGNKVAEPVDPKTVDYSKIDVEFAYSDGDKMKAFMEGTQNGDYDNKVVHITGIMSTGMMDPTTNSVMLKVGDGAKLGFSWRIVDANDTTTYPADGNKIELTGVILSEFVADWGMYAHYMYVLPENVKDLGMAD